MSRSVWIYAVLLVASLGWAYQTWTHEDELALQDKVVVVPGTPDELSLVVYRSEDLELRLELREDEQGRYAWGHAIPTAQQEPAPEPEGETEGDPPPPPPPAPEPEQFKVGRSGDTVIESLAPFVAKRRLEGISDDELADLGLAEPAATLEITREGKEPRTFELGGNVFGGANVYVRDPADGAIYLVQATLIKSLQSGARTLPDRDLIGLDVRNLVRLSLQVGERQASFTHKNPDDQQARFWAVAGESDKSPEADAWISKVLRMRSSRYVQDDEVPVDLAHAFDYEVEADDGTTVRVEVLRNFDDEGQEQYFARSAHTRGLVRLPRGVASEASVDLESALVAAGA